jgi:Bacterial PH domain
MTIESRGHEYEFEPQYGLPERLPSGEQLLWQGSPDVGTLARRVFHLRKLALYFAVLLGARAAMVLASGAGWVEALMSIKWFAPLAIAGLLSVGTLAWLTARTTVYTLTDKRVVMRVGIVLTVAFNLPLRQIEAAALRAGEGGFGDITLALAGRDRIAWLQLWPSVRPWRFTRPEPMLRAIPNAHAVAEQLMTARSAATGLAATPAATPASSPERARHWQTSPT